MIQCNHDDVSILTALFQEEMVELPWKCPQGPEQGIWDGPS